jgi:hypothetical protein
MSSDFFRVKKGLNIQPTDPSGLSNLQDGDIVIDSTAGNSMKVYSTDAGGFQEVGTGSGINYIDNNSFDGGVSGWTGDTNLVISKEDVSPLRGVGSLKIAKAAADASGEQVYTDFSVETADLAKKLTISFDYDASDANYSDDDMRILVIKDPAGTPVTIRVNGEDLKGGKGTHIAQFQTDATITDYRLVIEQVSTQASAVNILIDNVSVGPREVVKGAAMTDWVEYTPTFAGFGSPTSIDLKYRRVGSNLEVTGDFTTGTNTATEVQIGLPSGLTIASNHDGAQTCGWFFRDSASSTSKGSSVICTAGDSFVNVTDLGYIGTGSVNPHTPALGSAFSSTTRHSIRFSVPIAGWSSNAVTSEDLGGREVTVTANDMAGSPQITALTEDVPFDTIITDTTSAWSQAGAHGNDTFTAPETGEYLVSGNTASTANISGWSAYLYKNGVQIKQVGFTTGVTSLPFAGSIRLEKGDTLTVRTSDTYNIVASNPVRHNISINKIASPQTILETETVAARYTDTSGAAVADNANIKFTGLKFDTHNAYNTSTGVYTVPASGMYQVNVSCRYTSSTGNIAISINGTDEVYSGSNPGAGDSFPQTSSVFQLSKGDTIEIQNVTGSSRTISAGASGRYNMLSIARIK